MFETATTNYLYNNGTFCLATIGNNASEAALFNLQPSAGLSCIICPNPKASPNVPTSYTVTKTQYKSVTMDIITVNVSPAGLRDISYKFGSKSYQWFTYNQ